MQNHQKITFAEIDADGPRLTDDELAAATGGRMKANPSKTITATFGSDWIESADG
jgi:hypothetical protein